MANNEVDQNSQFFLHRVKENLQFYSAYFDTLETVVSDVPRGRVVVEKGLWGRDIINSVAFEGTHRKGREERQSQWKERLVRIGFKEASLNSVTLKNMRELVRSYDPNFDVGTENQAILLKWKDNPLTCVHAWTS